MSFHRGGLKGGEGVSNESRVPGLQVLCQPFLQWTARGSSKTQRTSAQLARLGALAVTVAPSSSQTKNRVFFVVGAKPGDSNYAEHISATNDALEQLSQDSPGFNHQQVGSASQGTDVMEICEGFEELCKKCPRNITLLISAMAADKGQMDYTWNLRAPSDGSRYRARCTLRNLLDNIQRFDCRQEQGLNLDAVLFTSSSYCSAMHVKLLPQKSYLLSFDTDRNDTGSRFVAPILKEAASSGLTAKDIAHAASRVDAIGGATRPAYQLSRRVGTRVENVYGESGATEQEVTP